MSRVPWRELVLCGFSRVTLDNWRLGEIVEDPAVRLAHACGVHSTSTSGSFNCVEPRYKCNRLHRKEV